ncbi:hypothetical protein [Dyadobacter sp. CY343]|uniref:hypothetical protein n=1 Tax=Dyadobacter sp. CY343 TaxID=2907299 RepID=UPI001F3B7BC1|nr:hypothetical protein [Dyadobacter sp. CY343]MCE7061245.1 hypothetical protein [Dyadobacter sp. CY343]
MKNLLLRLLVAIVPIAGFAQTVTVEIPTKEYINSQIKASELRSKAHADSLYKAGVVTPPVVKPPVNKPVCPVGPDIRDIRDITLSGATLQFHGDGVDTLQFEVWKNGGSKISTGLIAPKSSIVSIPYPNQTGAINTSGYTLIIRGYSCKSDDDRRDFPIKSDVGGGVVIPPAPTNGTSKTLGAYSARAAGRNYTFNKTPELLINFNADGTISDATEELDNSGPIAKLRGQNVFYMTGYGWFEKADGTYEKLQNIPLRDGAITIKQFVLNPDRFPNYETFKKYLTAYGERGVNTINGQMSQVLLSIHSDEKVGQGTEPKWLVVSRVLNFPKQMPAIDWRPYNKWIATAGVNKGDKQDAYKRVGIIPDAKLFEGMSSEYMATQAMTFKTHKVEQDRVLTADEAYSIGKWSSYMMGSSPLSYQSEELVENGQGKYDGKFTLPGYQVSYHFARGNLDDIRSKYPNIDVKETGVFGGYGGDDYYGAIDQGLLYSDRKTYEESLTSKLYKGHSIHGWTSEDHRYFTEGSIDVRNLNAKYYFWNRIYNLPYEFIALNERVKLATKTYDGKDRERNLTIFSTPMIESFVANDQGNKVGIEQRNSGDIIPYKDGDILTKMNTAPVMAWEEAFTGGFWSTFITSGMAMWDAPGTDFGSDSTKINWWSDQYIGFRKKGQKDFVRLNDGDFGRNGVPENSGDGLKHTLYASAIDAMAAGVEVAWDIRDRSTKKSFISYRSSRGEFIAKPGSAGFHLNGSGVPNYNLFVVKDAFDQKKGICIVGEGKEGAVLVYYNGFLSAHLYEDNVTVRYNGVEFNMGRAYGRQTIIKKL